MGALLLVCAFSVGAAPLAPDEPVPAADPVRPAQIPAKTAQQQLRGWLVFAGGVSSAGALVVWSPVLLLGPPTVVAIGLNAVATLLSLIPRQALPALPATDARFDPTQVDLNAIPDTLPEVDPDQSLRILQQTVLARPPAPPPVDVGAMLTTLAGYRVAVEPGPAWWRDPRIGTAALVTAGLLVLTTGLVTGALVTVLPVVFFAASFMVGAE